MKKLLGISLLEILLVIAVAGVIITLATRYYLQTHRSAEILKTTNQVKDILQASYDWRSGQGQLGFNGISNSALTTGGYLKDADLRTDWGGSICVTTSDNDSGNNYLMLYVPVSNQHDCCHLASQLNAISYDPSDATPCSTGTTTTTQCTVLQTAPTGCSLPSGQPVYYGNFALSQSDS